MKSESMIAIVGMSTTLTGTLAGSWLSGRFTLKVQEARFEREEQSAVDNAMEELLLAALQFRMVLHIFRTRWVDAASSLTKATGARRAISEMEANCGPARDRLFRVALQVSRWQAADRQSVSQAASSLIDAAGELSESIAGESEQYSRAHQKYEDAMRAARRAIDAWDSRHEHPRGRWRLRLRRRALPR